MADQPKPSVIEELRRELAEKSRLLSELDVMLADYQEERDQLIRELRALQARLRDLVEQAAAGEARSESE
jgi:uncharacterized coiled-coil protein SlyX